MNWSKFLMLSISAFFIAFPYNIIGCAGGDADPYDYFVSFFDRKLNSEPGYDQFQFTNYEFLYSNEESVNTAAVTSAEWSDYYNKAFDSKAAYQFVCRFAWKDLNNLYFHLEKKQPLKVPDSMRKNGMTQYFIKNPDLEALGYIMYAKQAEPQVTGTWTEWEPINRDGAKMEKLIKSGQQLYKAAKKDFIKLRYAYQLVRLAHYNEKYRDAKKWYDEMIATNNTPGAIQDLALGLKAGAMMRLGEKTKAAYIFSQLFSKSPLKRVSNYMSFDWCVKRFDEASRNACMRECKNDMEKANMLGLFLLGSNTPTDVAALKQVYKLNPNAPLLEILTIRELHKIEEYYFTTNIERSRNTADRSYFYYEDENSKEQYNTAAREVPALIELCNTIARNNNTRNKGLYKLAAAHAAYLVKDYRETRQLLDEAKPLVSTPVLKDQWELSNLLLLINSSRTVDAQLEIDIANSLPWLEQKARGDVEYARFIRRLFADVLAVRYYQQRDMPKYVLSMGVADRMHKDHLENSWGYNAHSVQTLRNNLTGPEVEALVKLMESKSGNGMEQYMVKKSLFTRDDVNDIAGTAFMRQQNWDKALDWYKKIPAAYFNSDVYRTWMAANPFADLMLDTHAKTKYDTKRYTKPEFAQKMKDLLAAQGKGGEAGAKAAYEYATGLYHMSYYGNSWMLVQYDWSSYVPILDSPARMNEFEKWYYTANTAEVYYKKAADMSSNKELKARSLYMAAKCAQKSVQNLPNQWVDNYKLEFRNWMNDFTSRYDYFPRLKKEFGQTAFYKEAYNTCSYFRDFVSRK